MIYNIVKIGQPGGARTARRKPVKQKADTATRIINGTEPLWRQIGKETYTSKYQSRVVEIRTDFRQKTKTKLPVAAGSSWQCAGHATLAILLSYLISAPVVLQTAD